MQALVTALNYTFRTGRLKPIRKRSSSTIVVFLHGILSCNESAYRRDEGSNFFWDDICEKGPFLNFDFAHFNYGRVDVSYLKEWRSPLNSLPRLALELFGYISEYSNVIFVAHSQGGLLAMTYAGEFYRRQGISVSTLHAPQHNRSALVMKMPKEWHYRAKFGVSYFTCGSINDNWIVKPGEATCGNVGDVFISRDETKKQLGHSHLASSPDPELLERLMVNAEFFTCSGLNREVFPRFLKPVLPSKGKTNLIYSRSLIKLNRWIELKKKKRHYDRLIVNPWNSFEGQITYDVLISQQNIAACLHGNSANFFIRVISNNKNSLNYSYEVEDLDLTIHANKENAISFICENCIEHSKNNLNPYKNVPFFPHDFPNKSLITNEDFLQIFLAEIRERRTLNTDLDKLKANYETCAKKFLIFRIDTAYEGCELAKHTGLHSFSVLILRSLLDIGRNRYWIEYVDIHIVFKSIFTEHTKGISLRDIEYLVSCFFRSRDCHFYTLDRDVREALHIYRTSKKTSKSQQKKKSSHKFKRHGRRMSILF